MKLYKRFFIFCSISFVEPRHSTTHVYQSFSESQNPAQIQGTDQAHIQRSPSNEQLRVQPRRKSDPSLVWALTKTFWKIFVVAAIFKLLQDLLSFASPQLLK